MVSYLESESPERMFQKETHNMIEDNRVELSSDQLASGLYFLIVSNGKANLQTLKFVKE